MAYPADIALGTLGEPLIVTDFMGLPGKPDGMTIARDGTLWVAMWGGACVVQIATDGALLQQIMLPVPQVSSVCLAADGGLFVTTSCMRLSQSQMAQAQDSGGLFYIDLT
jgi:sugar lactone lactonase YvrE